MAGAPHGDMRMACGAGIAIVAEPVAATASVPAPVSATGQRRGRLLAPVLTLARVVLRRPRARQLALRVLKRFPGLYARAYRTMMAPVAVQGGARTEHGDLSPRAAVIYRTLCAQDASKQAGTGVSASARGRRLAFVSPLPPERTGVANYAVELLVELCGTFEIELIVAQPDVNLPPDLAGLPVRQAAWFAEHGDEYDQVLYQFGNSPFHSHMFALLERHPGVVVLHDFFLGGALAHAQMSGAAPGAWTDALFRSHGYGAVRACAQSAVGAQAHKTWPCSLPVLEGATRVIVHSRHARKLTVNWFGAAAGANIDVIPHPRTPPPVNDRAAARAALGIADDCFLVCSFGFIAPNKLTHELLEAWIGSALHADRRSVLVLVGANHDSPYGVRVDEIIRNAGAGANIRIAGWTDDTVYRTWLQAADVGVQLRTNAHGESSGAVLDCLNYGLATIVNANGSMAEFPLDAVWRLPDVFPVAQLGAALDALRQDPARRRAFGARAVALLDEGFRPADCARLYCETLDRAQADSERTRSAWHAALAQAAPASDAALRRLAKQLAKAERPGRRQLLVDVSDWAAEGAPDAPARAQLMSLLGPGPASCVRVEPVFLDWQDEGIQYRYARNAASRLLGLGWPLRDEPPVDLASGDVVYTIDARSPALQAAARTGLLATMRDRGVVTAIFVRDMPAQGSEARGDLLRVCAYADRLLCGSEALAWQLATLGRAPEVTPP